MPLDATILKDHPNHTFVETGTYLGEGVEAALEAGFAEIWTVDVDPKVTEAAAAKFAQHSHVHCKRDDSALCLATLVPMLEGTTTFWLDAHPVGYFDLLQPDLPLINELLAISFSPRKPEDIILIDDLRLFNPEDQEKLRNFITMLWPQCVIGIIDSSLIPQDIIRVTKLA